MKIHHTKRSVYTLICFGIIFLVSSKSQIYENIQTPSSAGGITGLYLNSVSSVVEHTASSRSMTASLTNLVDDSGYIEFMLKRTIDSMNMWASWKTENFQLDWNGIAGMYTKDVNLPITIPDTLDGDYTYHVYARVYGQSASSGDGERNIAVTTKAPTVSISDLDSPIEYNVGHDGDEIDIMITDTYHNGNYIIQYRDWGSSDAYSDLIEYAFTETNHGPYIVSLNQIPLGIKEIRVSATATSTYGGSTTGTTTYGSPLIVNQDPTATILNFPSGEPTIGGGDDEAFTVSFSDSIINTANEYLRIRVTKTGGTQKEVYYWNDFTPGTTQKIVYIDSTTFPDGPGEYTITATAYDGYYMDSTDPIYWFVDSHTIVRTVRNPVYDVEWTSPTTDSSLIMGPSDGNVPFNLTFTKTNDVSYVKLFLNDTEIGIVTSGTAIDVPYNAAYDGSVTAMLKGYDGENNVQVMDTISLDLTWVKYIDAETLDSGITTMAQQLYTILHDPLGDNSVCEYEESFGYKLEFGASITTSMETEMSVGAEANFFGIEIGASQSVSYSAEASVGFDFAFEMATTSALSSKTVNDDADYIGPGYGDVYWGEGWSYNWTMTAIRTTYWDGTIEYSDGHLIYGIARSAEMILGDENAPAEWRAMNPVHNNYAGVSFPDAYTFDGGQPFTYTEEYSTSASISSSIELGISSETKAKLGIAETTLSLSTSVEFHATVEGSSAMSTSFTLEDDDPTDTFQVDVGADPIFGTPIFKNAGSLSSSPLEHGTMDYLAPIIGTPTYNYDSDGVAPSPSGSDQPYVEVDIDDESGISNAYLWYSIDGEVTFSRVNLEEQSGNLGTYDANIPTFTHGTTVNWYIEAFDSNDNSAVKYNEYSECWEYDVINRNPTVIVITPNGGSIYAEEIEISWSGSDPDYDDLEYSLGYSFGGGVWHQIISGLTNNSYVWDISSFADTEEMVVKVSVSDGWAGTAEDQSDFAFKIENPDLPQISILYPETGIEYRGSFTISWDITDIDESLLSFDLFYTESGADNWVSIATGLGPTTTSYDWNSSSVIFSTEMRIHLVGNYDLQGVIGSVSEYSDLFIIDNLPDLTLNLITPNGGEIFEDFASISWTVSTDPEVVWSVDLSYTTDGFTFNEIASNLQTTNYLWDLYSLIYGTNYRVRIQLEATYYGFSLDGAEDISQGSFTIDEPAAPVVSITHPEMDAVFELGDEVFYSYSVDDDSALIVLTLNGVEITDTGSFGTLVVGTYTFMVSAEDAEGKIGLASVNFTVVEIYLTVELIQPNGGETIEEDSYNITWSVDTNLNENPLITLYYSVDNGSTWNLIESGEFEGTYEWDISLLSRGKLYKVKITVEYASLSEGEIYEDISDLPFEISGNGISGYNGFLLIIFLFIPLISKRKKVKPQ